MPLRSGKITKDAPNWSQLRKIAPTLCGSVTESRTTTVIFSDSGFEAASKSHASKSIILFEASCSPEIVSTIPLWSCDVAGSDFTNSSNFFASHCEQEIPISLATLRIFFYTRTWFAIKDRNSFCRI